MYVCGKCKVLIQQHASCFPSAVLLYQPVPCLAYRGYVSQYNGFMYYLYMQFAEDTVNILDGISDWPPEVVQEQSSK